MNRYERLNALLGILADRGPVEVEPVAAELAVSAATIRRDLDHLAQQQLLTRTRGGAVATNVAYDLPLRYKTARHASEKQRIGAAAAALVQPGMVVGTNGGTTTTEAARALATRADVARTGGEPAVTLVTNAVNIANELAVRPHVKLVLTGGVARPQSYELIGPLSHLVLEQLTLDVVLLGVDALDPETGASAHHEGEASVNRLLASRGRSVVVLADGSKLGRRAFATICPPAAITTLITSRGVDPALLGRFREAGIEVVEV